MVDSSDSTDVDLFTRRFIYNIYSDAHTVVNAVKLIVFSSTSFHVDSSETFSPLFGRSVDLPVRRQSRDPRVNFKTIDGANSGFAGS